MKNFRQRGDILTVTAPTGGVISGDVVKINQLIGVAITDAAEGAPVEAQIEGVFEVAKASSDDVALGEALYWDETGGEFTLADAGNTKAGLAANAAGAGLASVLVRLTPGAA